jgi:peptidoglycan/LPS O-acetylase OafA/YrhL
MKPHYPILDGLRGTAAILVVIFHLLEAYFPVLANHPMHHGYLAVDFFFLLSGFVIGYAYDDRWPTMSIKKFFTIRLIRLHPLVIISIVIGSIAYWFDPFPKGSEQVSLLKFFGVMLLSFTLLPSPDVRGWGETHSINGPLWSLFQEYIANFIYAIFGRKLSKIILWILVIVSAVALTMTSEWHGDLGTGWSYSTFWIATIRMIFPFFAGLLLYRTGKLIRVPMAYIVCSLLLTLLFFLPSDGFSGLYDAACVIVAFPLIVAMGAGGQISGRWAKICKFSGDISYPIYIIHYPFIYIYTSWIAIKKPEPSEIFPVAAGLFIVFILLAYFLLKFYDEPVRAWLKKKYLDQRAS